MIAKTTEGHKHKYVTPHTTVVPVRRVYKENGKTMRDTMVARDKLLQRKCACGAVETYDMERKKI